MMDKMYVDACRRCRETRDVTGRLGRFVFLGAIASQPTSVCDPYFFHRRAAKIRGLYVALFVRTFSRSRTRSPMHCLNGHI
jgi:hypothetical protein